MWGKRQQKRHVTHVGESVLDTSMEQCVFVGWHLYDDEVTRCLDNCTIFLCVENSAMFGDLAVISVLTSFQTHTKPHRFFLENRLARRSLMTTSRSNEEWVLASYPEGVPTPDNFRKQICPMPVPGPSQVLVKTLCLSVDPYLRLKLYPVPTESSTDTAATKGQSANNKDEEDTSEFAPFKLNKPLSSMFIGEVVSTGSDVTGFAAGDRVSGLGVWATFAAFEANTLRKVPSDLPPSAYLNVLGLIGLSTYFPLVEIGQPKAGETVYVSSAAGAVGSLVGQLCKLWGCRVIGSTGSDNKAEALKALGFDHVFNYRTQTLAAALEEWAPEGLDLYWDNVGGATLDTVLTKMKRQGRIVACGSISQYHVLGSEAAYGVRNYFKVVASCLKWQGFLASDYVGRSDELFLKLGKLLREKKIRALETVWEGLEKVPEAFIGLFSGNNLGKMLIQVAEPSTPTGPGEDKEADKEGGAREAGLRSRALEPGRLGLEKELAEVREMAGLAHGAQVKAALAALGARLEKDLANVSAPPASSIPAAAAPGKEPVSRGSASPSDLVAGLAPTYTAIDTYGWDQGEYNSPWVSVYVTLPGVGKVKERVFCSFGPTSFDLKVEGLAGKNYRLLKDNLEKEIVAGESKFKVKEGRVTVLLKKKKGEFGSYDHWMGLTAKTKPGGGTGGAGLGKGDPMGGLMDMMKQMYEEGDDTMRKTIAESMMKVQRGDRSGSGLPEFGKGGLGEDDF